jgi:predicted  nucleic acid-binding Zn-ribbon protein
MGVSAEQAGAAIQKMSKILADVSHIQTETYNHNNYIVKINTDIGDLKNRLIQTEANANMIYAVQDHVDWAAEEITAIKDTIGDMQYQMSEHLNQIAATKMELHDLRPDLDALIEISKQKTVLEKIEPIVEIKQEPIFDTKELDEWYDNFMKELKIIL